MAPFSRPTAEQIRAGVPLARAAADLRFQALTPGVDNFRHDVHLSPTFVRFTAPYTFKLFVKHANIRDLLEHNPGPPSAQERVEFKRLLQGVLLAALNRAKAANNSDIDLLANVALFKYLGSEIQRQYGRIILDAKNKLKMFEGPRHERNLRAFQLKQLFTDFQGDKRNVVRRVSGELLAAANEVQADAVRKTRESFFGSDAGPWFAYFSNPLVFTDSGRDDYIHLTRYVMFGNFTRDPDRYELVEQWLKAVMKRLDAGSEEARELEAARQQHLNLAAETNTLRHRVRPPEKRSGLGRLFGRQEEPPGPPDPELVESLKEKEAELARSAEDLRLHTETYNARLDELLTVPENVEAAFGVTRTEQALADLRQKKAPREEIAALEAKLAIQEYLAEEFYSSAQEQGLLPYIAAAYETAAIYQDYCPPINPQQLKHSLLDSAERKKVAGLIEHYKLPRASAAALEQAAGRVRACQPRELRHLLFRFLTDFARHHRDARLLAALQGLMDRVNLLFDEKTRRLSRINHTLYEFLLPEEEKPRDDRVLGHVILKADVRDSTALTADLLARGLNPASHFSLNFYEPLNKLLPKYAAEKVFIEGDAVILSIFEKEGPLLGGVPVARACGLAREMMEVVAAYNSRAEKAGLPKLEIGIGICWQDTAPVYLLDGETRIMISSAINQADRLSGCSKLARKVLNHNQSLFNVYVFQTISEDDASGAVDEFLVRYNTGICLSDEAFRKLEQEISLTEVQMDTSLSWPPERVKLHCGSLPLPHEVFQRLVIREAHVSFVDAHTFAVKEYTGRCYYEVCSNRLVYEYAEQALPRPARAST